MTFKRIIAAVSAFLFITCLGGGPVVPARAQTAAGITERLGIPGPIRFGGVDYRLAWTAKNQDTYFKQEYVPAGETVERYKSMLMVELLIRNITVKEAVAAQAQSITARKKDDPVANMAIIAKDGSEEVIVDFVLQAKDAKGEIITEWNGYRYAPYGKKGIVLFAVSRRAYGDAESLAFLKELKENRQKDLSILAGIAVPRVKPDGRKN